MPPQRLPVLLVLAALLTGCRGALMPVLAASGGPGPEARFRRLGPVLHATNPYQVYVIHRVPAARLRSRIPARFELVTQAQGPEKEPQAYLVTTWFPQDRLRLRACGPALASYGELNVRTPVRDRVTGARVHWMLPALAEPPWGTLLAAASGLCAEDVPLRLTSGPGTGAGSTWYAINAGRTDPRVPRAWIEATGARPAVPPGFGSLDEARRVLLDPPLAAHATGRPGHVGWMVVEQPRLRPRAASLRCLAIPTLAASGLLPLAEQGRPEAVWATQRVDVRIGLLDERCVPVDP